MKPYLTLSIALLFFLFNITVVSAQTPKNNDVKFLIDTTITIMKANALNAGKVDWAAIKKEAYKGAYNLNNAYELGDVMRNLFKSIGDFHGGFFQGDSTFRWKGRELIVSDSVRKEWSKGPRIKTEMLGDIGYIRVPSMSQGNGRADWDAKAQQLNDSLCTILSLNPKGIILDVRLDGGGVMFPMILGLKQILGEGKVGSFHIKNDQQWLIKGNTFFIDSTSMATIIPKCITNAQSIPCVLLIGPGTGSSGEFLVMAFKGRAKTVLIGTETAGYVTVNNGFGIKNGSSMNLSVGSGQDRNGQNYTEAIQADVILNKVDHFNDLKNDEKVQAAVKWLKNQK